VRLAEELAPVIEHSHHVSRLCGSYVRQIGPKYPRMSRAEAVRAFAGDSNLSLRFLFQHSIFAHGITAANTTLADWEFVMNAEFRPIPFRYAMCNEAFEGQPFNEVCRTMRRFGYEGIEIAPFTLAPDPLEVSPDQRREYARIMADEGISFVGLHWLLVTPKQIHVTTPDRALREQSWQYVRNLVDLCADVSGNATDNGVMVFGSPKQRSATGGIGAAEATRNFIDGLAGIAAHAELRGVTILVEALPHSQSNVIHTIEEAVQVVREIGSPAVRTMFDSHNAEDETEPHDELIARYYDLIRHVHVNEMDGSYPGCGNYDFPAIFRALKRLGYTGWISLEAFNFEAGAETIALEAITYLKKQEEKAKG